MKPSEVATNFLIPLGLEFKVRDSNRLEITGGTQREEVDSIHIYHNGFTLWEERDATFSASVVGRGQLGHHIIGVPLDEALAFIAKRYP